MRPLLLLAALALPLSPLHALSKTGPELQERVEAVLAQAPAGTRYGLLVTTLEGEPVVAIAPDQRFIPASNTKMFTTAAAYARLAEVDAAAKGTGVALTGRKGRPDVVLVGRGDARLSSAADCKE